MPSIWIGATQIHAPSGRRRDYTPEPSTCFLRARLRSSVPSTNLGPAPRLGSRSYRVRYLEPLRIRQVATSGAQRPTRQVRRDGPALFAFRFRLG